MCLHKSMSLVGTLGTVGTLVTVGTVDTLATVGTLGTFDTVGTVSTLNTVCTRGTLGTVGTVGTVRYYQKEKKTLNNTKKVRSKSRSLLYRLTRNYSKRRCFNTTTILSDISSSSTPTMKTSQSLHVIGSVLCGTEVLYGMLQMQHLL